MGWWGGAGLLLRLTLQGEPLEVEGKRMVGVRVSRVNTASTADGQRQATDHKKKTEP